MTTSDSPATAVVHLDGQTHTVSRPRARSCSTVLLRRATRLSFPAGEGHRSACATTVVRGEVEMETNDVLEPDDLADGLILAASVPPRQR